MCASERVRSILASSWRGMAEGESERIMPPQVLLLAYHRHVLMMTSLLLLHGGVWRTDRSLYEDSITSITISLYKHTLTR